MAIRFQQVSLVHELNDEDIVAVPLMVDETITVGYITQKNVTNSTLANIYFNI